MSLRTDIQNDLIDAVMTGTFYKVTYINTNHNKPTQTVEKVTPSFVWVNSIGGALDKAASKSARDGNSFSFNAWNFVMRINFPVEVDEEPFLTQELGNLKLIVQGVRVSIKSVTFAATHPVTAGSQTGTQLEVNLTVETRR